MSDPASGYPPRRTQAGIWIDTWTPLFTSVLFATARRWKQPTHTRHHMGSQTDCVEYYSALKRKDILARWITQMVLEGVILSEISQTQKDTYCMAPCSSDSNVLWRKLIETQSRIKRWEECGLSGDRKIFSPKAYAGRVRVLCVYQMALNCAL